MTNQKLPTIKSPSSKRQLLPLLCILALTTSPLTTFAQGPRLLTPAPQSSQLCAATDNSERCRLIRAVSAAQDDIDNLRKQLKAASDAIAAQQIAVQAANDAIAAGAKERAAYDSTIKLADKAIEQQQAIITTYEHAIATMQTMVDMAMKRIDALEKKVDKANGRAAILGALLTAVGVVAAVIKR